CPALTPPCRWVFLVKKGYQEVDTSLHSSVVTKVKGVAYTNTSELGVRLWDVADYVIPPQGENVFFIVTNLVVTPHQQQGVCAENEHIPDGRCSQDSDCPAGVPVKAGNGVKTGRCLLAGNSSRGTCEIFAWCPVETRSKPKKPLLGDAEDFTIYIKNFIHFPKFNFSKTNVLDTKDTTLLKSCHFGPKNHYCPIFRLGSVVRWAGSSFEDIALEGGVIGIHIEWNCDLDKPASECNPHYAFSRLDHSFEKSVSTGYNFRFAKYYRDAAGVEFRILMKAYGIRFDVLVNGKAGKFNIIPTVINLASGVALMSAVSTAPSHPASYLGLSQCQLPGPHGSELLGFRAWPAAPSGSDSSVPLSEPESTRLELWIWQGWAGFLWGQRSAPEPLAPSLLALKEGRTMCNGLGFSAWALLTFGARPFPARCRMRRSHQT
uniref:P2X purinoceptor n=1 Tax=Oryctolagus cuniculus TaxID=9986 RepID=A0A5F9C6G0_RABIT